MKKKLLSIVLALVMGLGCMTALVACRDKAEDEATANTIIAELDDAYDSQTTKATINDYKVDGVAWGIDNVLYTIKWSLSSSFKDYKDYVKLSDIDEDNYITVKILKQGAEDINYVLTASVQVGRVKKSISFPRVITATASGYDVDYNFSSLPLGSAMDGAAILSLMNGLTATAELTAVTATNAYAGNSDKTNGPHPSEGGFIKIGTSSKKGEINLTFTKQVSKVVIDCQGWKNTDKLSVNGSAEQVLPADTNEQLTFELATPSAEVKIESNLRALIYEIFVYYAKGVHNHVWEEYTHVANTMTHTKVCKVSGCEFNGATQTEPCNPELNVCTLCDEEYDAATIVDALFKLESNKSLPGTYELTGVITDIEEVQNGPTFYNCTFTMEVEDKEIIVYRAGNNDNTVDYTTIDYGDTVTVIGSLTNYHDDEADVDKHEFTSGCKITSIVKNTTHEHSWTGTVSHVEDTMQHTLTCVNAGCTAPNGKKTEDCTPDYNKCATCNHTYTPDEILTALFAMATSSNKALPGTYELTGVVKSIKDAYSSQYGNVSFYITISDKDILVYRAKDVAGSNSGYAAAVKVGDTVTIRGSLKNWYNDYEFDSGCTIESLVPGTSTEPEQPTTGFTPITSPVAGTSYKLAMNVNGTWYYMTGAMNGNYGGSTTNVADAATITLEQDGDGWVIKANGKYVEIVINVSGGKTYNNVAFNTTKNADIHWVWNAEHSVFTWTNDNGTYWLGNYGNYNTFSTSLLKYITNDNQYIGKIGTYSAD